MYAYNKIMGAPMTGPGVVTSGSASAGLADDIRREIPELNSPNFTFTVWNFDGGKPADNTPSVQKTSDINKNQLPPPNMHSIKFKVQSDITLTWKGGLLGGGGHDTMKKLAGVKGTDKVGIMQVDKTSLPHVTNNGSSNFGQMIGARSRVIQWVQIGFGESIAVKADSFAYVVPGSGATNELNGSQPRFRPTFYVALGK